MRTTLRFAPRRRVAWLAALLPVVAGCAKRPIACNEQRQAWVDALMPFIATTDQSHVFTQCAGEEELWRDNDGGVHANSPAEDWCRLGGCRWIRIAMPGSRSSDAGEFHLAPAGTRDAWAGFWHGPKVEGCLIEAVGYFESTKCFEATPEQVGVSVSLGPLQKTWGEIKN